MTAGHNEEGDVKRSGEELGNFMGGARGIKRTSWSLK